MDYVMQKMESLGVPKTRENYLALAYFGNPPNPLSAEENAQLPKEFQKEDKNEERPAQTEE